MGGTGTSIFLRHAFAEEKTLWLDLLPLEHEGNDFIEIG